MVPRSEVSTKKTKKRKYGEVEVAGDEDKNEASDSGRSVIRAVEDIKVSLSKLSPTNKLSPEDIERWLKTSLGCNLKVTDSDLVVAKFAVFSATDIVARSGVASDCPYTLHQSTLPEIL